MSPRTASNPRSRTTSSVAALLGAAALFLAVGCRNPDAELTSRVQTEVSAYTPAEQVTITTARRIVTLEGIVEDTAELNSIDNAVRRVPGVIGVDNRLKVKQVVSTTGAVVGDTAVSDEDRAIRNAVRAKLTGADILDPIAVDVRDGVVTLRGDVSAENREAALTVAHEAAPDAKSIEDHLNPTH